MLTDENVLRMHVHGLTHRAAPETDPPIRGGLHLVANTSSWWRSLIVGTYSTDTDCSGLDTTMLVKLPTKQTCWMLLRCSRNCRDHGYARQARP